MASSNSNTVSLKTRSRKEKSIEDLLNSEDVTNTDILKVMYKFHISSDKKLDEVTKSIKIIESQVETNTTHIKNIMQSSTEAATEVESLKLKINSLEQQEFSNDIVVSNLPENEISHRELLTNILNILGFDTNCIKFSFQRIYETNNLKHHVIIARFNEIDNKQQFMAKIRSHGPLFIKQIIPDHPYETAKIYINERLTIYYSKLLKECRDLIKSKKLVKCHYSNRQIFVKIQESSAFEAIKSREQLKHILEPDHQNEFKTK